MSQRGRDGEEEIGVFAVLGLVREAGGRSESMHSR